MTNLIGEGPDFAQVTQRQLRARKELACLLTTDKAVSISVGAIECSLEAEPLVSRERPFWTSGYGSQCGSRSRNWWLLKRQVGQQLQAMHAIMKSEER